MGLSAFAAPVNEATIDMSRKASLSVYQYDITSAEKDGVWTTDGYQSTGVYDETGVNNRLDVYKRQGLYLYLWYKMAAGLFPSSSS